MSLNRRLTLGVLVFCASTLNLATASPGSAATPRTATRATNLHRVRPTSLTAGPRSLTLQANHAKALARLIESRMVARVTGVLPTQELGITDGYGTNYGAECIMCSCSYWSHPICWYIFPTGGDDCWTHLFKKCSYFNMP
jgi:hypothetical protein